MLGIPFYFPSHPLWRTLRSRVHRAMRSWRYDPSVQGEVGNMTTVSEETANLSSRGFQQPQDGCFFTLLPHLGAVWVRGSASQRSSRKRGGGLSDAAKAESHSPWAFTAGQPADLQLPEVKAISFWRCLASWTAF